MLAIFYSHDERTVLTLDAGGTNFVFSAIQGGEEIVKPIHLVPRLVPRKKLKARGVKVYNYRD